MNCVELVALLSEYLDGALAEGPRATLEAHFGDCERCLVLIETTRATILLCRDMPGPGLDPQRRDALLHRLEQACRADHGEP